MCCDVDLDFGWHRMASADLTFSRALNLLVLFGESDGSAHGCGQSMPIINGIYK
jgi:hypothetical protein